MAEWAEFYELEPFGFEIDDGRFGQLCSTILASVGAKVDQREFMLRPPAEVEPEDEDIVDKLFRVFGGKRPAPKPSTPQARL